MPMVRATTKPMKKSMNDAYFVPDWPAPASVRSLQTTRHGGVSKGGYATLNLGDHVGDDPVAVAENRRRLAVRIAATPIWLDQVHGTAVLDAGQSFSEPQSRVADAAFSRKPGVACVVMTADCLPVLLCNKSGTVVAAAHAGWRGLSAGILDNTVVAMACPGKELLAYLGPAIGPQVFEVGDEVRAVFVGADPLAKAAFIPHGSKWLANIALLARQRLASLGVAEIFGGNCCSAQDVGRFFSYRRNGVTGRMASVIWLV